MNQFTRGTLVTIILICLIATMSYTSIPNNPPLEENNTPMYDERGDSPHRGERIGMILTQEENHHQQC